jgi:hypothetical protein
MFISDHRGHLAQTERFFAFLRRSYLNEVLTWHFSLWRPLGLISIGVFGVRFFELAKRSAFLFHRSGGTGKGAFEQTSF